MRMAGYHGYSMSNNAVTAYANGEMPKSKWTKTAILSELRDQTTPDRLALLKGKTVAELRELALKRSSWHHTSSHYNRTDFYVVDTVHINSVSIQSLAGYSLSKKEEKPIERTAVYLEWSGTRKHPKATEVVVKGIVKGNWFHLPNGTKKSITANGFRFLD